MSSNSQRFAEVVLAAFEAAGHFTVKEVGDAGGPSSTTMTALRSAARGDLAMTKPRNDTMRKIEDAADWQRGSATRLWDGGSAPKPSQNARLMREALDIPEPTPEQKREQRRLSRSIGVDGYVERLADRLLEVEERLDLLEARLSEVPATVSLARAADQDQHGEQTAVEEQGESEEP